MKQVSADKYTIAWFKIAECVARGEKEKALGVFRLLSHSIDSDALIQQLQGDIFLSFEDYKSAVDSYCQAVESYKKNEKFLQAAALCEQILILEPATWHHAITIIGLYTQLHKQDKINQHIERALDAFLHADNNKFLPLFLAELREMNSEGYDFAQEYLSLL